ncbi:MAG TPA: PadR family transcriptional regulator [Candidatus Limnocylindrales bacterium]|nr:PadR family transcriptional regulator [Candidatus Limnocylindrales bacterium]
MTAADRVSALGYALLAALAREPMTGYALAQLVRDPIGFFWETRHSQIYPELARLEAAALVASTFGPGPGPRPKRTYAATDAGLAELRAWIAAPSRFGGRRDELLLKVYASWLVEPSVTLGLVQSARRHHESNLERYLTRDASARARGIAELGPRDPRFADYLTLRRGIDFERGRIAWCDWVIDQLAVDDPGVASARRRATP